MDFAKDNSAEIKAVSGAHDEPVAPRKQHRRSQYEVKRFRPVIISRMVQHQNMLHSNPGLLPYLPERAKIDPVSATLRQRRYLGARPLHRASLDKLRAVRSTFKDVLNIINRMDLKAYFSHFIITHDTHLCLFKWWECSRNVHRGDAKTDEDDYSEVPPWTPSIELAEFDDLLRSAEVGAAKAQISKATSLSPAEQCHIAGLIRSRPLQGGGLIKAAIGSIHDLTPAFILECLNYHLNYNEFRFVNDILALPCCKVYPSLQELKSSIINGGQQTESILPIIDIHIIRLQMTWRNKEDSDLLSPDERRSLWLSGRAEAVQVCEAAFGDLLAEPVLERAFDLAIDESRCMSDTVLGTCRLRELRRKLQGRLDGELPEREEERLTRWLKKLKAHYDPTE